MNPVEKYRQQKSSARFVSKETLNAYINLTPIENEPGMYVGTNAFDGEQYRIPGNNLVLVRGGQEAPCS